MALNKIQRQMLDDNVVQELNGLGEQLAEKTTKGQIAVSDIDKNKGKFDQTYMSEEFLQQMAGNTPINAVPADESITLKKLAFYDTGKNLFNKNAVTVDVYVNNGTGILDPNTAYNASDFISVESNTEYTQSHGYLFAFYDSTKTYISGLPSATSANLPRTFTTPVNAKYARFSVTKTLMDFFQVEKGNSKTSYENYKEFIRSEVIEKTPINVDEIPDSSITEEKVSFLTHGKNLFDGTVTTGNYVNWTSGAIQASAIYDATDFIPVEPNTVYSRSVGLHYAWYDENKNFISGASETLKTLTSPANAAFYRQSIYTGTKGSFQFEKGSEPSVYEPYTYYLNGVKPKSETEELFLNIPSTVYALVGQEFNIYFDNIINGDNSDYHFDVVSSKGQQFERMFRIVPTVAESIPITIKVLKDNKEVALKSFTLKVVGTSVGSGLSKKVIVIGDSTTNNGIAITKLNENFSTDVMGVVTLGTRGTAPNNHEGRSGWTARHYVANASVSGITNAFYNSTTSAFDFSYYITNNAITPPDYVVINLGINDLFSISTDSSLETKMQEVLADYETMIDSIQVYSTTIKIGIALTIPPNYSQDAFAKDYSSGQTRQRYKRNNVLWVKKLIETYAPRGSEGIYLVPINLNIDTLYNFGLVDEQVNARNAMTVKRPVAGSGVHPAAEGYWQIADSYWYWLKSFEV